MDFAKFVETCRKVLILLKIFYIDKLNNKSYNNKKGGNYMNKSNKTIIKKERTKNPILDAIIEYIDDFNLKFAETKETFKKARLSTSDRKEQCVAEFFLNMLPSGYSIKRGEIFDYSTISNSIDCVILTPNHPKLKTPMRPEIILAEGVLAAIEVKPDIASLTQRSELFRGLKQADSVKKLSRNISRRHIDILDPCGYYKKIPFILFSKKSGDVEETLNFIVNCVNDGKLCTENLPDIIFSLDGWLIYHTCSLKTSIFEPTFKKEKIPDTCNNAFMLFKGENQYLICILLLILFHFVSPNTLLDDFIIKDYILKLYNENKIPFSRAIWYE